MEKISALIDKLQELKTTGATLQSISYYVQLLQAEILHARGLEREREREIQRRQSHIAVILPGAPLAEPELTVDSNGNITAPQFTASESIPVPEYKHPEPPAPEPVGIIEPALIVNQPVADEYQAPATPEKTPEPPAREKTPEITYQPPAPNVIQPDAEKTPAPIPVHESLKAYQSAAPTPETLKAYRSPVSEQDALKAYRTPAPEQAPAYQPPVPVPPTEPATSSLPPVTPAASYHSLLTPTEPPAAYQPPIATPAPEPTPAPKEEDKQPVFIHLFGDARQPVVSAIRPEKPETHETNGIHSELKELNQKVAQNIPSLNDRLRQSQSEIGDRFNDMPVKDLRQAIGINDKFQFIQELFRGDVDSYERSIKTINEMHSIQDAEYWIERELKIRQGWVDDNRVVRQFYALVKKRFS
ncbi:hypothetical protein [Chitinophaga sancti]|uniref:hypothetical protein n=1 Tax=Chitinophaga sancti TaxID=1004 RepID=UPI003F7956AB